VKITFWGTRGSIAAPGPATVTYGGDTSCVAVVGDDPRHLLILDAGSGIRELGRTVGPEVERIDLLLSHLHLDHIVGLGFFEPLFRTDLTVAIWAPPATAPLWRRLGRYLSPPLFPVHVRELGCELELHEGLDGATHCGEFTVEGAPIVHPGFAFGYRITRAGRRLAYLPDHEPALSPEFPRLPSWTSGYDICRDVDLLIHDGQYGPAEYEEHVGWGHSSVLHAVALAEMACVRELALFHHDPAHDDATVERLTAEADATAASVSVTAARQGRTLALDPH
jgi:phosphoribosyl 1,2-cyclic phosphodiesterase